jgi:DNA polymerase III gamma/tau subunit
VHPDVVLSLPATPVDQDRDGRAVIDQANFRPFEARRRVVVIDEADALVEQAQHALLKTLEEPPPASIFLLVSSLPTRC